MSDPKYNFQCVQKLVILNEELDAVLLAKRKGEQDYDGIFSFIGGKMETADGGLLEALKREKDEEIGRSAQIGVLADVTKNTFFVKKDGNSLILPHYAAIYRGGEIELSDEYSEYEWVNLTEIDSFEPMIPNIPEFAHWAHELLSTADKHGMTDL